MECKLKQFRVVLRTASSSEEKFGSLSSSKLNSHLVALSQLEGIKLELRRTLLLDNSIPGVGAHVGNEV